MNPASPDFRPHVTILFQGDSITDAFRKPDEVNESFQLGAGYAFLAASQLVWDFPETKFRFINRGISGHATPAIAQRWLADVSDFRPDIITLLAGVNDVLHETSHEQTEASYREIICLTRESLPNSGLILFEPFLLPLGEVTAARMEDLESRRVILRRLARELEVQLVPLQPLFDKEAALRPAAEISYDGIHVSPAGAILIARAWLGAIIPLLTR